MPPAAPLVFILGNKSGSVSLRVSGTNRVLRTWIDKKKNVWAQMPVPSRLRIRSIKQFQIVELEGITQVVTPLPRSNNSPDKLKQQGLEILKRLKLIASRPASGVMFVSRQDEILKIDPVVWVRDIKTLFYETACASGTTAVGLIETLNSVKQSRNRSRKPFLSETSLSAVIPGSTRNLSRFLFSIRQPTGNSLKVLIKLKNGIPDYAEIGGPVNVIKKLTMSLSPGSSLKITTINCR